MSSSRVGGTAAHTFSPALAGLAVAMLLASLGTSIANVALPTLSDAFDASFHQTQWIILAYLLATTSLIVSAGRIGDIFGRRRALLTGVTLFAGASIACASAPGLWVLVGARAVQGLGAALMMALALAFVGDIVPRERTGSAMGLLGTTSAVGTALGPSLGGVLISTFGWRSIFVVNVPLAALALFLIWHNLPIDRKSMATGNSRFDLPGTILLAATLGTYALAMTTGRGNFGTQTVGLLVLAGFILLAFLVVESRVASPLIRLSTFRDRNLNAGLGMSTLVSTVMMATLVVGPFYLTQVLELNAARIGLVMSIGPLVVALSGMPLGRVVDRSGPARLTVLGLGTMAIGTTLLAVLPKSSGVPGYLVAIVVTTVGYAAFQTSNNTAVMADVSPEQRGVISGMLNLSRNLGLITGASALGAVFAVAVGTGDLADASPAAVAAGMHATFAVSAVLIGSALGLAVVSRARSSGTTLATQVPRA